MTNAPAPGTYQVRLTAEDGRQWELGQAWWPGGTAGPAPPSPSRLDMISAVRLDQPGGGPGMVAQLR